jgi:hypothetical protein
VDHVVDEEFFFGDVLAPDPDKSTIDTFTMIEAVKAANIAVNPTLTPTYARVLSPYWLDAEILLPADGGAP